MAVVYGEFERVSLLPEYDLFRVVIDETLDDMGIGQEVSFSNGERGSRVRSLLVDDLPDREIGHALGRHLRRKIGEHTHEEKDKRPCQARAPTPSPHRRCGVE